jgi:hypothetical protein
MGDVMTNEPGFRMLVGKLKQQLEAVLNVFNVSLSGKQVSKPNTSGPANLNGLTLEIGNELMITDEIIKSHKGLLNARGRVVIIDEVPTTPNALIKASAFGIQVNVGMNEAQQMRAAYLFREQTSTAT